MRKAWNNLAYGSHHKQMRKAMLYKLKDGTPCEYCGQPLYKEPDRNFDEAPLELDHIDADITKIGRRLLHRRCNRTIITKWAKHGPGWYALHGNQPEDLSPEGGTTTQWPS